jgi:sortase family protein
MTPRDHLLGRIVPAVIVAAGVTLLAAGLLSYTAPPLSSGATPPPTASPTAVAASPSATASPTVARTPSADAVASRVVVPALKIDLPVVSGALDPPGNPGNYPLCDVAQYLTDFRQPGQPGATYIYGHARTGMFLPLLEESQRNNGAAMIGALVQVYTNDSWVYLYEIYRVKRHATDFALAENLAADEHRLILQTSEGPRGTIPKLQVAARLLNVQPANPRDAKPSPKPRICA